jgi:hypothetical protein
VVSQWGAVLIGTGWSLSATTGTGVWPSPVEDGRREYVSWPMQEVLDRASEGIVFLQNMGKYWPSGIVLHPRKLDSSAIWLRGRHISHTVLQCTVSHVPLSFSDNVSLFIFPHFSVYICCPQRNLTQGFHAYFITSNLLYELFCKPVSLFSVHSLYLVLKYYTFR